MCFLSMFHNMIKMFSPKNDPNPFGKSWEYWTAEWWRWLMSIPKKNNPCNDATGNDAGMGQTGKDERDVWFLTGTRSARVRRTKCVVPVNKGILFPIATMEASIAEFGNKTEDQLLDLVNQGDQVDSMGLEIEIYDKGKLIDKLSLMNKQDLLNFEYETHLFDAWLPEHNIWPRTEGGNTQAVSHGYWVFLDPLPPGEHKLRFSQVTKDDPATGTINCKYDVIYDPLTVR